MGADALSEPAQAQKGRKAKSERAVQFGARIRKIREARSLPRERLAAQLELSAVTLYHWEFGFTEPSVTRIYRIADALGVRVADLFPSDLEPRESADSTIRADDPTGSDVLGVKVADLPPSDPDPRASADPASHMDDATRSEALRA